MTMKTAYILLMAAATITAWGQAGTMAAQNRLTPESCVEMALGNNARTKRAANELDMAREGRKEALTHYFPTVSASGAGFMADKGMISLDIAPGMGMSMMKNGIVGGVTATQPVFAGGQIANANRLAKVNVEKYGLMNRQAENEVRLTAERYYWQMAVLKEKLRTIATVERLLERLDKDVEASVRAGVCTRNDLLQVRLRRNEMASTRLTVANNLALSKRLLAQYIGLTPADSIDVAFNAATDTVAAAPDALYADPGAALSATPEYGLLQAQLAASKLERKMATGKRLPTVAVGGGYMYDNLTDRDKPFWMGFATVSVPLSDWWAGSHDIRKQKKAVANSEIQLNDQSQLLMIRMQGAWDELNEAYRQTGIARSSIEQADENLRLNQDYYRAGTATMSELLDAQAIYRQSCDSYVEARAKYEIKKREYLQATGR